MTKRAAKEAWEVIKRLPGYILPISPIPADAAPPGANIYMMCKWRDHIKDTHYDDLEDENCPTCRRLRPK